MNKESWLSPSECLEMGFATSIVNDDSSKNPSQSVKKEMQKVLLNSNALVGQSNPKLKEPEQEPAKNMMLEILKNL